MSEDITGITWSDKLELYFKETGERAEGLAWIHKRAEQMYSLRRTYIDLPIIFGSGIIAFLNAGSQTMFEGEQKMSSISLGIASLAVGLLNTVGTYFGWAKRAEGHRISAIQYSRLYRFLRIELGLPREERMTPSDLLKYTKDAYDRLQEISPLIPPSIETTFVSRFGKVKEVAHPEEVNGLNAIDVFVDSQPTLKIRVPPPSLAPQRAEDVEPESRGGFAPRVSVPLVAQTTAPQALKSRPQQGLEANISPSQVALHTSASNE